MLNRSFFLIPLISLLCAAPGGAQTLQADELFSDQHEEEQAQALSAEDEIKKQYTIFDDKKLLDEYYQKYAQLPEEILLEMIKDDTLAPYKTAAVVRLLNEKFISDAVASQKNIIERALLRRLSRDDSAFVEVEVMYALCTLDRYHYFAAMVPALIQKLSHYNVTISDRAFEAVNSIIESGNNRQREARIIFNTLRKILFLSRKRLAAITDPGPRLTKKLKLLRWSIKVLGSQELKKLPKEVISLL